MVQKGKDLFERNIWIEEKLEIHNYLGKYPCGSCHDQKTKLQPEQLAKKYGELRSIINREIQKNSGGTPLPLKDPAMDALIQYMTQNYRLSEYKILE